MLLQIKVVRRLLEGTHDLNVRTSLANVLLERLHTRDLLQKMILEDSLDVCEDFLWKIQLRYNFVSYTAEEAKEMRETDAAAPWEDTRRMKALGLQADWHANRAIAQDWLVAHAGRLDQVNELSLSSGIARVPYGFEYTGSE